MAPTSSEKGSAKVNPRTAQVMYVRVDQLRRGVPVVGHIKQEHLAGNTRK